MIEVDHLSRYYGQHRAVDDFLPHRRIMTRATVLGDRPVFRA